MLNIADIIFFLNHNPKDLISDSEDSETSIECGCSDSCGEEEDSEEWHRDLDDLLEDVAGDEALPEPSRHQSSVQSLTSLLQWFIYFVLFWQATTKLSDNGLEWLLRFLFQFLHILGITCNSHYLCQLALLFPSSLYLLRKFVNLKRDNFVKFAVCPKCAALYQLNDCTRLVGGQIESNVCNIWI